MRCYIDRLPPLLLGFRAENEARKLTIDVTAWRAEHPDMWFALFVELPEQPGVQYPAPTVLEGNELTWVVTDEFTVTPGEGLYEVFGHSGEVFKRSGSQTLTVLESGMVLSDPISEVPDVSKPWVDQVLTAGIEASMNASKAEAASETAEAAAERAVTAGEEVRIEKESALTEIAEADTEALAGIANAKSKAIEGIAGAETASLESIEQAKDEALEEIGESTGTVAGAITPMVQGDVIALSDSAGRPIRALTIYGRTTQDGTPSPDVPVAPESVGADGAVEICMCGANLLDIEQIKNATANVSVSGTEVTLTANSEGTYRQSKRIKILTASSPVEVSASWELVSRSNESHKPVCTGYWYKDGVQLKSESFMVWPTTSVSKTVTPPAAGAELHIIFALNERTAAVVGDTCTLKNIMFNVGAQMPYEAHKKQNATTTMANGLPGVPVTSGGNYTDANGQQWIADSIEYDAETGAGERVQRVARIDGYAGEAITGAYLSTTGELSEGATVIYALETPIKTEISAEEIASIAGMKTHYPNTTIYNSDGAHMAASYVADTKNYIDQKIAAIAAATIGG